MEQKYNPQEFERKWQQRWAADNIYEVREGSKRPKFYALTMFPYTSGDLHIGHWYAMAPSDPCQIQKDAGLQCASSHGL
jgi:leucyl-tRNA synthetase